MKPIRDLLCLGRAERGAFGVKTAPIARDRHDFGMLLKPFGKALGGPIRQKLYYTVQVQIHQDRSILLPFAPSPIVNSQVANGRSGGGLCRLLPNAAQYGVITCRDGQTRKESLCRPAPCDVADQSHDFRGSIGLATVDPRYLGESLAEDLA